MALGKREPMSPIIEAIRAAEKGSSGEIRVHLSQRWFEWDPFRRATRIFNRHQIWKTPYRTGVLLYVNLRKKKFAIVGDIGIHKAMGQRFWEKLARELQENLRSTHRERAISLAVASLQEALQASENLGR